MNVTYSINGRDYVVPRRPALRQVQGVGEAAALKSAWRAMLDERERRAAAAFRERHQ